jgi:hypothetical protein
MESARIDWRSSAGIPAGCPEGVLPSTSRQGRGWTAASTAAALQAAKQTGSSRSVYGPASEPRSVRCRHQDRDHDQPSQYETGKERKHAMQRVTMEIGDLAMLDVHEGGHEDSSCAQAPSTIRHPFRPGLKRFLKGGHPQVWGGRCGADTLVRHWRQSETSLQIHALDRQVPVAVEDREPALLLFLVRRLVRVELLLQALFVEGLVGRC